MECNARLKLMAKLLWNFRELQQPKVTVLGSVSLNLSSMFQNQF